MYHSALKTKCRNPAGDLGDETGRSINRQTDRQFGFPVMFSFHAFLVNSAYKMLLIMYPICIE
jgi:hypothetical protein